MKSPTAHMNCGTNAGYYRHYRRHERACEWCRDAHNESARQRRREQQVSVDAHLFTAVYLDTTPARQVEVEAALGRTVIDRLVERFDRAAR
ncbi:hypothetical protein [Nocardia sp. NPDC051570]|uniref:hypothetical protein n=1 Tax=Nocardia sp. NPDC051570 TaxID=3364324 RepID=UPI0037B679E4